MGNLGNKMEEFLQDRLAQIKKSPVCEIKKLPSYSDEDVEINGKICTLATWTKNRSDGIFEVVIQIYYAGWGYKLLGAGMMTADGFLIDPKDKFLKLPDEIRLEYR